MSTPLKKAVKSKFSSDELDEFIDSTQNLKGLNKTKKIPKRLQASLADEDENTSLMKKVQASAKKRKEEFIGGSTKDLVQGKLIEVMENQIIGRKHINDNLLKNISELTAAIEADYAVQKNNNHKLQQLTAAVIKCNEQAALSQEKNLKALIDIQNGFKKRVEGLLQKGGMKPDDRPLWFDVYKAFPPIAEPKYAKPAPEIKPIRQILYKEDAIRAKFHSRGHGLAVVNMLNPAAVTQTKQLLTQYEKLKAEGIPESEILEKSAEAVGSERQQLREAKKPASTIPEKSQSVSAQVLKEADLKNIFSEDKTDKNEV